MPLFEFKTELVCSADALYDFLLRPKNVERISSPSIGLTFVKPPEVVEVGSRIDFELNSFGRVNRGAHEIIELVTAAKIVERQVEGAMREWLHSHLFEVTDGGVKMIDRIEFKPPGGILGYIVTEDRVLDSLEDGFFYRQQQLQRLVQAGELS